MTWTSYTTMLEEIAGYTAAAGAEVWMVSGPASIPGVPADQYERLDFDYNSVWSRDYGPFGINEVTNQLGIVDTTYRHYFSRPDDDAIPCEVAGFASAACYTTSLILDGGNLMTDGRGNLFMTKRTYDWNDSLTTAQVDQLLIDYFGVDTIHDLDYAEDSWGYPVDGTGHIDMFAKLLAPCKVLVAETNDAPFSAVVDAAADYFSGLQCAPGQYYQVYRIPAWEEWGTWYTYTNSLIVNQTVIIPSYADGNNLQAQQIYEAALPGYTIELVDSDASITSGGSIHCITKEIPEITGGCGTAADCDLAHVDQHDCLDGECTIISCDGGWADCNGNGPDGCETQLGTSQDCATCDDSCGDDFPHAYGSCQSYACVMGSCHTGYGDCDASPANGCETSLGSDTQCSDCTDDCTDDYPNAAGSCQGGSCSMGACLPGYADCDASSQDGCETVLGSDSHCAACNNDCSDVFSHASGSCQAGVCQMGECQAGYADCNSNDSDGCETQLGTSQDCTACDDTCEDFPHAYGACQSYACVMGSCHTGYGDCDASPANGCETSLGSDTQCSDCTDDCTDDYPNAAGGCLSGSCSMGACQSGYGDCDGSSLNGCETVLGSDSDCAACNDDCSNVFPHASSSCQAGACQMGDCLAGYADCDDSSANGCETELGTVTDCSACQDDCRDRFSRADGDCQNGSCRMGGCESGYADCNSDAADGCEIQLGSDENCSSCGDNCDDSYPHAEGSCISGHCAKGPCLPGYADCNFELLDGCEVELGTDANCSACADNCTDDFAHAGGVCRNGSCSLGECAAEYGNCDGADANGCETDLRTDQHCGACSNECNDLETCQLEVDEYRCIAADCQDADADGYRDISCGGADCDDTESEINPSIIETCDEIDNDCDGLTDEGDVCITDSSGCGCSVESGRQRTSSLILLFGLMIVIGLCRSRRNQWGQGRF